MLSRFCGRLAWIYRREHALLPLDGFRRIETEVFVIAPPNELDTLAQIIDYLNGNTRLPERLLSVTAAIQNRMLGKILADVRYTPEYSRWADTDLTGCY